MTLFARILTAGLLLGASMPAAFAQGSDGGITVEAPWSRATPPGARVGIGYMTIRNEGAEPDRLIGARSERVPQTEVHSMSITDGVMEMDELTDGLEIPANGTARLEPGSYHLMLVGLEEPLVEGESVPVTLLFETAGEVEVELAVGSIGARGPGEPAGSGVSREGHGSHGAHSGH